MAIIFDTDKIQRVCSHPTGGALWIYNSENDIYYMLDKPVETGDSTVICAIARKYLQDPVFVATKTGKAPQMLELKLWEHSQTLGG